MASQSGTGFVGNLRPTTHVESSNNTICYKASKSTEPDYSYNGPTLLARGLEIDVIDGLAGSQSSEMVQSSRRYPPNLDAAEPGTEISQNAWMLFYSIKRGLVLNRGDRYLQSSQAMAYTFDLMELWDIYMQEPSHTTKEDIKEFRSWIESSKSFLIEGNTLEDILRDSCNAKRVYLHERVYFGHRQQDWLNPGHVLVIDPYVSNSFYGRFVDTVVRMSRRLMTTFGGRIGMAPQKAMKGDIICILYGCSIPMVLRRKWDKNEYTVVGECYLDKFMAGEALELEDVEERTFHIT